jgi:hypothetical protein
MDGHPVSPGPKPHTGHRTRGSIVSVVLAAMLVIGIDGSSAIAGSASLERVVDTSAWHHPSPDPTGISRVGSTNRFAVVDGEVEETALWKRSNVWSTGATLQPHGSWSATRFTLEPSDVAMPSHHLAYLSDDDTDRIIEIKAGPDLAFGTPDDVATGLYTRPLSLDPEGIAVGEGTLIIADGDAQRVVRLGRGTDGVFGSEDDVVRRFRTAPLGLSDPEGIAFFEGNLFIVSRVDGVIVQTTRSGAFVDSYDISSSGIHHPSGIAVTADDGALTAWVTDRGVDNDTHTENDGRIYVFSLSGRIPDPPERPVAPRVRRLLEVSVGRLLDVTRWIDFLPSRK